MWKHIASVLALSAVCLCSCEKIYDYEGDCDPHWQVKFVYDYNMKFADAFPGPMGVGSVRLYVFDAASGRLVLEKDAVAGPAASARTTSCRWRILRPDATVSWRGAAGRTTPRSRRLGPGDV